MTIPIRQSTASQQIPLGYFLDPSDGDTEETSLTIANTDIKLWKHGATTLANKNSGGATHISNGIYYCVLDATDSNTLGGLVIFVHVAGALAIRVECEVMTANRFDALVLGTDVLHADMTKCGGNDVAAGAIPNAAADAAGGLPISDAGGLDLDTKLANTNEITVARMGALTDWIDGNRLDLLLDAILNDTGTNGVVVAPASKTGYALSSAGVDAIQDDIIEGTLTSRQIQRILLAGLAGKTAGGGTATLTFQDAADTKPRITATVDVDRNRTTITLDGT